MRIRSPWLTRLAARLVVFLLRALYRTCRVKVWADVPGTAPFDLIGNRRYIFCIWHDQLLTAIFGADQPATCGLVSRHQDGSYLADAMQMCHVRPVRGSSSRGGAAALRELIDATREYHVAITPDGPRGPRRELKQGILFLASQSGRQVVATASNCRRKWRIQGSWTDMMFPLPFTTICVRVGRPIDVPPHLDRDQLEHFLQRVQQEMQRLDHEVEQLAAGIDPALLLGPSLAKPTTDSGWTRGPIRFAGHVADSEEIPRESDNEVRRAA